MRSGRARANAHGRIPSLKPALELFPDSGLHARKLRGIGLPPLVELCGNGDGCGRIGGLRNLARESGEAASRIEGPFDDKAVRRKAEVERIGGHPVEIWNVTGANRAEPIQVEVGVSWFERVEGPLDEPNAATNGLLALEQLQLAADAAITILGQDAGHVRMEIGRAITNAGYSHRVADHAPVDKDAHA